LNSQKDIYIFIGPPGSGKGTLSQYCIKKLGWRQLSTGALCRKHINENTEIGKKIDFAIKSGKLISDELVVAMVEEWLLSNADRFNALILDGFPRTTAQAEALHNLLYAKLHNFRLKIVKFFISDDVVVKRLCSRLICKNNDCQTVYSDSCESLEPSESMKCDSCNDVLIRRSDDTLSAVQDRLKIYHMHERYLLEFYQKNGFLINHVNVEKPLDDIFIDFQNLITSV
jgi:adenylate kinase